MKTLVLLHGNPGSNDDWQLVETNLGNKYRIIKISIYHESILSELKKVNGKFTLIAYSLGAHYVAKYYDQLKNNLEKIILITPYFFSQSKLSTIAKSLIGVPVIGNMLINSSKEKSLKKFLSDFFDGSSFKNNYLKTSLYANLDRSDLWLKTIKKKIEFENDPLTKTVLFQTPVQIIWAENDKIVDRSFQEQALYISPYVHQKTIANTGHAIILSNPDEVSKEISLFVDNTWNKIGYDNVKCIKNNVISFLESHLVNFPQKIALKWVKNNSIQNWDGKTPLEHDQITFSDFAKKINSFAVGLKKIGIERNDRVIILLPMSVDMYVAMFAVQKLGAIAVFLDSWARGHHLGATAECVNPKAMISFKQAFDLVDQVAEFKNMPIRVMYGPGTNGTHLFQDLFEQGSVDTEPVECESTALITFTTGSTGKPKGANRTHRFLSAQHHALNNVIPYTTRDNDMPAFPIFSLNNLACGVTTILPAINLAAPGELDSAILVNQLHNQKISCSTLSPSMFVGVMQWCQKHNFQLKDLKRLVTGGAPISRDNVEDFYKIAPQADLWVLYGSTEAEPMAHIEGRQMLDDQRPADPELVENGVNVGHISEDVEFKFINLKDGPILLDKNQWHGVEVSKGQVGEFICTGDHVCQNYYNNEEAFHNTKIRDDGGKVWHRTGDLGYLANDNSLWLVGRVNNVVKRNGKLYFPVKAEIIIKRLSFTYRCAFLGLEDNVLGEKNCVVVELSKVTDREKFNFSEAKNEIKRLLSKNDIPVDCIHFINSIPMDPRHHSKVEYKVLRQMLKQEGVIIA